MTRDFGKHNHSTSVALFKHPETKHKIVKKVFAEEQAKTMEHEIRNLRLVKKLDFVPKLYHIDRSNRTLYLSYCGKRPKHLTTNQKEDVQEKLKLLKKRYQLSRSFVYPTHFGFPRKDNLAVHHGTMKLIDFGPPWKPRGH
jgi:predicted Ser/Thr protein kinase